MRIIVPNTFDMMSPQTLFRLQKVRETFPNDEIVAVMLDLATYEETCGPVLNKKEEIKQSLEHCKYIDSIHSESPAFLSKTFVKSLGADFVINIEESPSFIDLLKGAYELKIVREMNSVCDLASRDDLLARIIKDMDQYIIRNLNRGYQRKELNVSWAKASALKLKASISNALFCGRRGKQE